MTTTDIEIETTTPEHTHDGYWDYEMTITVADKEYSINCWYLATWLERGASQDIDGSGLQNWGSSQPGGWRVKNWDGQSRGIPTADHSENDGFVTVSNTNDSIEIKVPDGIDPDEFIEMLDAEIENAVNVNEPDEPEGDVIWEELGSYSEMENHPIRIGKIFGSNDIVLCYENSDGDYEFELNPDPDDVDAHDDIMAIIVNTFKEEYSNRFSSLERE
jgi:hypothetical protein